jgi:hypothetical protein
MPITPLPAAPETTDTPQQFNTKAFAWVQSLDTFVTEANAQATTVNSDASAASSSASTAASEADDAADSAAEAAASVAAAQAAANVTQWSSGATYAAGANVWSPITYFTYRNKTGTNTATDPSSDSTNWELISGNVTTTGTETLTNKTLTEPAINQPVITGSLETKVATSGVGSPLTQDIDLELGNWFEHDLSVNSPQLDTTFSVSNVPASGTAASFILEVSNPGSATVTWFPNVEWAGGNAPTLTAAGRDVLAFYSYDAGTTWNGFVLGQDMQA